MIRFASLAVAAVLFSAMALPFVAKAAMLVA